MKRGMVYWLILLSCVSLCFAGPYDSWDYKRTISLSPITPVANYQIKIILDNSTFNYENMLETGDDIRFADSEGSPLNYWFEEWTINSNSTIWVKIPSQGTSYITMYYGNNASEPASNGTLTFELFDDFNGSSLDSQWEVSGSGSVTVTDGYVTPSSYGSGSGWYGPNITANFSSGEIENFTWQAQLYWATASSTDIHQIRSNIGNESSLDLQNLIFYDSQSGFKESKLAYYDKEVLRYSDCLTNGADCITDGWHEWTFSRSGSLATLYLDEELKYNSTVSQDLLSSATFDLWRHSAGTGNMDQRVGRVFVSKYDPNGAVVTIGVEQQNNTSVPEWSDYMLLFLLLSVFLGFVHIKQKQNL